MGLHMLDSEEEQLELLRIIGEIIKNPLKLTSLFFSLRRKPKCSYYNTQVWTCWRSKRSRDRNTRGNKVGVVMPQRGHL